MQRTSSGVAGFVVFGEVAEVEVFKPGDPFLVLLVVGVLGPLHCWGWFCGGWLLVLRRSR